MTLDATEVRRLARWPWLFLAGFLVTALLGEVLSLINGSGLRDDLLFIVLFFGYGAVGALIVSRMPGNRIGFLLMYVSGVSALNFLAEQVWFYRVAHGANGTLEGWLAIMTEAGWLIVLMPGLLLLLQLYPDGAPVSRGGRWLLGVTFAFIGFAFLGIFAEPIFGESPASANPLHVEALAPIRDVGELIVFPGFMLLLVASIISLTVRYRRSTGPPRQQIRWMAFAAPVLVFGFVIAQVMDAAGVSTFVSDIVVAVALATLPIAIGIAILRYRLWDLDLVVRKAVLAAFVVVILMVVFGVLTLMARATVNLGGGSDVVVAALVGFAVWPAFRLARRLADRVVYGGRATPYEVLAGFADRIGATYAGEDVLLRMVTAVGEGIGAERADVWFDHEGTSSLAATWPTEASPEEAVTGDDERSAVFAIEFNGEPLGRLGARKAPGERMSGTDHKLLSQLAAQSGPLLHNADLTEELKARLVDLHAAQRRLVTAQDVERRRLERNIHDGAQQQLVALAVKLKLADALVEGDPTKAHEMLEGMHRDTQTTLDDLRDLARGIYPPLLADQGLAAALAAQARRSPVPVAVEASEDLGRFAPEVEAAVYFSCLEGLQNVAKYAEATNVLVSIERANGHVAFAIRDDGRGFDRTTTGMGMGLQGIADRVAALAGELEIASEPGHGTTIAGRVPADGGVTSAASLDAEPGR